MVVVAFARGYPLVALGEMRPVRHWRSVVF
jgi:hypothetical protein